MADYYPLLAKAVSGLKTSTPEARGAIYERARKALLGQLRSMQPPAPESAIEREAKALDEAVARLEREFGPRLRTRRNSLWRRRSRMKPRPPTGIWPTRSPAPRRRARPSGPPRPKPDLKERRRACGVWRSCWGP